MMKAEHNHFISRIGKMKTHVPYHVTGEHGQVG